MLSKRVCKIGQVVFIAIFVACVLLGSFYHYPATTGHQEAKQESKNIAESERAEDRIAKYNLWLAIFTGLLVGVSAIQIHFLRRADKTARITAEAAAKSAKVAEDALFVGQRPYLFVEAINFAEPISIHTMRGQIIPHVLYRVRNEGRTPAIVSEVSAQFIFDKGLPDIPDYWNVDDEFPETRAIGADKHQDLQCPTRLRPADWDRKTMEIRFTSAVLGPFVSGSRFLFFYGYIKYRDIFGSIITFGHCWRYYAHLGRYLPEDNKAYNYRKVESPPAD